MKSLVLAFVLTPAIASADDPHPEELFLGEGAWLQDRGELQVSAMPSLQRNGWEVGAAVEYGLTPHLQIAVEGAWVDGAQMDALRHAELGALFAPLRTEHIAIAMGASASVKSARDGVLWSVEPVISAAFFAHRFGSNVAISTEIGDEVEPTIALGLFTRLGSVVPLVEASLGEGEISTRTGVALRLGDFEIAAAVGIGSEGGVSAHAALSWELELADNEAGREEP